MQPAEARLARFETLQLNPSGLLFQDRFDTSSDGAFILRSARDRRRAQNGTLVKTHTLRYATDGDPRLRSGRGQQKQGLLTLANGARVSPNVNFSSTGIEAAGGFVVELDFSNSLLDDHDLMRWVGLRLFADETTTSRGYVANYLTLEYETAVGGDLAGQGLVDRFRVLLLKRQSVVPNSDDFMLSQNEP